MFVDLIRVDNLTYVLVAILAVGQGDITTTTNCGADESGTYSIDLPCHALDRGKIKSALEAID